jgi:hypothetical protein
MSSSAAPSLHGQRSSRSFGHLSFAVMLGGGPAFLGALIAAPETLDDVCAAVRELPLLVEGFVWLLGFPFLGGLAIWQSSWVP